MATPNRNARAEARRKEREEQQRVQQRRQWMIYGGVGLVVLLLAVGIAVMSVGETDDRPGLSEIAGDPTIEGDPLPPVPEGGDDPMIGEPAPVVEGEDFDGTPVTIGEAGEPMIVSFAASWCPACDAELPSVVQWLDEGGLPEGVEFAYVITNHDDSRTNWPPQDWFAEAGYTGPVLRDDINSSAFQAYGFNATPSWAVIDGDGNIQARLSGMVEPEQMTALAELALTE